MRVAVPVVQRVVIKVPVASKMSVVPVEVNALASLLSSMSLLTVWVPAKLSSSPLNRKNLKATV
jgi:hypothetical protein